MSALIAHGAVIKEQEQKSNSRQKRTLGLLTVGAQALSGGVGKAAVIAGATIAAVTAIKPLILLGVGKCKSCIKKSEILNQ